MEAENHNDSEGQELIHITNSPSLILSTLVYGRNSLTVDGWIVGSRRLITLDTCPILKSDQTC